MKKRTYVLLFAICLVFAALAAGCNKSASTAAVNSDLEQYGFKESGYPIVTKPYTLKVLILSFSGTTNKPDGENSIEIIKKLEAKTGIHIEWQRANQEDWGTQKALVLASGEDLPDIFWPGSLDTGDLGRNPEIFTQLDDLIDRYAPNIKAIFASDPVMEKAARYIDGKIWYLPMRLPHYMSIRDMWAINKSWLDKLGLKEPATTEELYQVLKAFKTQDPNGNGKADEIPASFLKLMGDQSLVNLLPAFGIYPLHGTWWSVTNDKVQYIAAQDGFKDAIAYFHRLYSEGLIDQELFTQTQAMLFAKFAQPGDVDIVGLGAAYDRGRWGNPANVYNTATGTFGDARDRYKLFTPVAGPKGDRGWTYSPEAFQVRKFAAEISSAAKHPEIAMRWLDALYEEETSLELFYGPVGTSLIMNSDGTYFRPPMPEGFDGNWAYSLSFNTGAPQYTSAETSRKLTFDPGEDLLFNEKESLAQYAPKQYWPTLAPFTIEENEELSVLNTDIGTLVSQQTAAWITQGGVEKEYDAFIARLNSLGLPRLVEIYQGVYDRYNGK